MEAERQKPRIELLRTGTVCGGALAFAALYDAIARGTYDFDEFVYLLLGRAVAHGRVPYRDFLFYHPPGIVLTVALLDPLVRHWWAWARALSVLLDAGTCALVYLVARRLTTWPIAIAAGLLCASSPIMLATGTRIMPDTYIMFFTFLAIYLLLQGPSTLLGVIAGAAFGIAVFYKYPAGLILPACLAAAGRRRWPVFLATAVVTTLALFAPFLPDLHALFNDTIVFQSSRAHNPIGTRFLSVLLFLVLLQPLALFGLLLKPRAPWWLILGYLSGFAYVASSQVYYHYMVPEVPFAAILGAMYLASLPKITFRNVVPAAAGLGLAVTIVWAAAIEYTPGTSAYHVTAVQAASLSPVSTYIQRRTAATEPILDDRPDLPVLANRHNCDDYFWNDATVITAQQLMPCLASVRYVVHFYGGGSGYPPGFLENIDRKWCKRVVGSGGDGAYVYDLKCVNPALPQRN